MKELGVVLVIVFGSTVLGFVPLPAPLMLAMIGLTLGYVAAAEVAKKYFYARVAHA